MLYRFLLCHINEAIIFYTTIILALCYLELLLRNLEWFQNFSFISDWIVLQRPIRCYYAVSNFLLWQQRRKVNIHAIITRFLSITFHQQLSLCLLNNGCQLTIVITDNICIVDGTNFTAIFSLNSQSKYLPLSLSIADGW